MILMLILKKNRNNKSVFMKSLRNFLFVIVAIAALAFGLKNYYNPLKIGEIKSIRVDDVSTNSMHLAILMPVENILFFDIKLVAVNLDFKINGIDAGKIESIEDIDLPANSTTDVNFPAQLKFQDFLSNFLTLLQSVSSDNAEISLKGTLRLKMLFIEQDISIDKSNVVTLKK
jgi:LEA14-like dessication related protein